MATYRKTYGVRGLLEWKMTLRAGKARIRVAFTGGSMGGNGVIPAKYVTDSPAIQRLIESSGYFRSGMVYLHGAPVEINDGHENRATDKGCGSPFGGESDIYA